MNILLVEDSKAMMLNLKSCLEQLDYHNFVLCSSVSEARKGLAANQISLVISDWHMLGESGFDLLKYMKDEIKYSNIPFIMVTTEQEKRNIFKAVKLGLQAYLYKPINKDLLKKKLDEMSKKHNFRPPYANKNKSKKPPEHPPLHAVLKFKEKTEIVFDGKKCALLTSSDLSDQIKTEYQKLFPDLQIALITKKPDDEVHKKLLEAKITVNAHLEFSKPKAAETAKDGKEGAKDDIPDLQTNQAQDP